MFQFGRLALYATILQIVRFPHSEITGSNLICKSPVLIAAYHVFHRLWEPRHPPCTLSYFLLLIRLLRRMVCFYFDSCCILQNQEPRVKNLDRSPVSLFLFPESSESQQSSTLLFSLSIYFFQYVKERSDKSQEFRVKSLEICILILDSLFLLLTLVENNGFEPLTPCVQGRCSSQLS